MTKSLKKVSAEEYYELLKKYDIIEDYIPLGQVHDNKEILRKIDEMIYEKIKNEWTPDNITILANDDSTSVTLSFDKPLPNELMKMYFVNFIEYMELP